ncbi:MAG: pyridoxamine 5'-phosphate oxidase family protein [Acidimicrobiales bacterium]|nr:pyridoxamine 5'-phosphate oxidase family protein [Acidimicrobiales bacterium]
MAAKASPRMTPEEIRRYLVDGHTGILTTLRRDGVPIAMPLWYACIDGLVYAQTRGKKMQRIRNDPRASFLVESGEHWKDLKAVHCTGTAEVVDLDAELSSRFRAEMDRKYAAYRSAAAMPKETSEYYAKARNGIVRFPPDERGLPWDNTKLTGG